MNDLDLLDRWIVALRSDEYRQGHQQLKSIYNIMGESQPQEKYCCLGVLCDISGMGAWNADYYTIETGDWHIYLQTDLGESGDLFTLGLDFLAEQSGKYIDAFPPEVEEDDWFVSTAIVHSILVRMNDNGYTFGQIADVLEKIREQLG